jgi:hypothetical protein
MVLSSAKEWLRDRNLYVIDLEPAQPVMTPASSAPCSEQCQTAAVLEAAKAAGVDYVMFFRVSTDHTPQTLSVTINGFAVKSGKEIFTAAGTEFLGPEKMNEDNRSLAPTNVLCHALATVWQYRPGGYSMDKSRDYCHIPVPRA